MGDDTEMGTVEPLNKVADTDAPEHFFQSLNKYFDQLKQIFEEVLELKSKPSEENAKAIAKKQQSGALLFVALKALNRQDKYLLKERRDALEKQRNRNDSKRLLLQNLRYEIDHINREIQRCFQFKSEDETIDLVSEEEFYNNAPLAVSRSEITRQDDHARRMARLDYELQQRKGLYARCTELTKEKERALEEIEQKRQRLNAFMPSMLLLLKATHALQTALEMPLEQKWEIGRLVKLLPQPLYVAYMNLQAYIEASEPNLSVTILGTEDDVRAYENQCETTVFEDIVAQSESSDEAENPAQKRKKHPSNTEEDQLTRQREWALQPHPLALSIVLNNKADEKRSIGYNFHYFPIFGFATVTPQLNANKLPPNLQHILAPAKILDYLYEYDSGNSAPSPKLRHQLKKILYTEAECLQQIQAQGLGKPYKWVQRICCSDVLESEQERTSTQQLSLEQIIPETINAIKRIWQARLSLVKQITALENKNLDMHFSIAGITPAKHSCSLVQWTSISWEDVLANKATERFRQHQLMLSSDLLYRAVIVRGSSKLECLVSISCRFPAIQPIWVLSLYWNGQHDALNNAAICDMEQWTNCLEEDAQVIKKCGILPLQLSRTMSSFDIYLETEGQFQKPVEFPKEKPYFAGTAKRMRARPYSCVQNEMGAYYRRI